MSVIVKNNLDQSYRYFIKGAPEKIIEFCNIESLPKNYLEILSNHTQNGFRVLACATKDIPENDYHDNKFKRKNFNNDLVFLGLIIFKNMLKRDTKLAIKKLNKANMQIIVSTGDNPFTTISVATESTLINKDNNIYLCDINDEDKTENYHKLNWYIIILIY